MKRRKRRTVRRRRVNVHVRRKTKVAQWKKLKKSLSITTVLFLCFGATIYSFVKIRQFLLNSQFFAITDIKLVGLPNHSVLKHKLSIRTGDNIFSFKAKNLRREIFNAFPELNEVKVKRHLPQKVILEMALRKPLAWTEQGGMKAVDSSGKIFPLEISSLSSLNGLPQVYGEENKYVPAMSFLMWAKQEYPSLYQKILKISCEYEKDLVFFLNDGTKIAWGVFDKNLSQKKLKRLQFVESDLEQKGKKMLYANLRHIDREEVIVRLQEPN